MRCACILIALVLQGCSMEPKGGPVNDDIAASLEEFANRRIYTRLDPTILRSIKDADIEQVVFDYAASKLEDNYERESQVVSALPPGVRALYLSWVVEAEVNNGGFNQYYYNTDSKFSSQAVEAFQFFGATEHAALMREANDIHAKEATQMAKFKDAGTLEAFSESYEHTKLGPLDERFYKLVENLSQLRIARIRQTPEQFSGE
jgi:hypothetical protein